jgi:hypothetical protein
VTTCKGIVKGNVVMLEEGAHLSDGVEVEVRLSAPSFGHDEAFVRVLANRMTRYVGMDGCYAACLNRSRLGSA